jgi:hypothetical protein
MPTQQKTAVPSDVRQRVAGYLSKAIKELEPFAVSLTPEEKRRRPVLGERSYNFVENSYSLASANPRLVPVYLDMDEFEADFTDIHSLMALRNLALRVFGQIENRRKASGSGALAAALKFYQNVKITAARNIPGAQEVYRDLKSRFKNMGRKKTRDGGQNIPPVSDEAEG